MGGMIRGTSLFIALWACASIAHAHISLEQGGTHMSRYGDSEIKAGPCGRANGMRGTNVYTYRPGETINVTVAETIPHPGYFRVAFDQDGHDSFVVPSGTEGTNGNCSGDPKCGAGKADYCSNDTVLLDNLSPHGLAFGAKYTFTVTLPNVECNNCTLQIIQMMNDLNVHRAPYPADDIYYQCIDIVLSNSAMDVNVTPVTNMGMVCEAPGGGTDAGVPPGTGGAPATMDAGVPMAGMGSVPPPTDAGGAVPPGTGGGGAPLPPPAGTGATAAAPPTGTGGMVPPAIPPMMSGSGGGDSGGCAAGGTGASGAGALGLALWLLVQRRRRTP